MSVKLIFNTLLLISESLIQLLEPAGVQTSKQESRELGRTHQLYLGKRSASRAVAHEQHSMLLKSSRDYLYSNLTHLANCILTKHKGVVHTD